MGIESLRKGEKFEDYLSLYHRRLYEKEEAFIWKVETGGVFRGGRWQGKKAPPDYCGTWNGRLINFDAKYRAMPKVTQGKDQRHQAKHLWRVHKFGGIAFLLYLIEEERGYLAWPQEIWGTDESFSYNFEEPGAFYECPPWADAHGVYIPDWMSVVKEMYG